MWPIVNVEKNELLICSFSSKQLICSLVSKNKNRADSVECKYYERFIFEQSVIGNGLIFNQTLIKSFIEGFIVQHKKQDTLVAFILVDQCIVEKHIACLNAELLETELGIMRSSKFLWGYQFMYHNDHGQSVFYAYKVRRALLLQYKLLAISMKLNLIAITTEAVALYGAYKNILGGSFRQSQYAVDMMMHNNIIKNSFSVEGLQAVFSVPETILLTNELSDVATMYGFYMLSELNA